MILTSSSSVRSRQEDHSIFIIIPVPIPISISIYISPPYSSSGDHKVAMNKGNLGSISSSDLIDAKLEEHQMCGSKHCPGCGHKLDGKPVMKYIYYTTIHIYIYGYVIN